MTMKKINSRSFTIMELLIVIGIIAVLAAACLILLNPFQQINKSWDAKRKQELAALQKTFQDYYNDNSAFPTDNDVCYDAVVEANGICSCHICGQDQDTPTFSPYLTRLPCDPQHGKYDYLYQYNCTDKNWFKVYALIDENDPVAATAAASNAYDYVVTSGNIDPAPYPTISTIPEPTPTPIYCAVGNAVCQVLVHGVLTCNLCSASDLCHCLTYCTVKNYFVDRCDGGTPCQMPEDLVCP